LRIEIEGQPAAPALEAGLADIQSVENAQGWGRRFGLLIRLDSRFDPIMAGMTQDRDGQTVVVTICGQEMLRATLRGAIPSALFTLSLSDRATRWRVRAALESGICASTPIS
jgi:hypothetical protein